MKEGLKTEIRGRVIFSVLNAQMFLTIEHFKRRKKNSLESFSTFYSL